MVVVGGLWDSSVSPSPFGLDFGTLDFGTLDLGLTICYKEILPFDNFRKPKMGRTHVEEVLCRKSSPAYHSFLPHFKIRNDKLNIAKISVTKLSKIVDPQSKLRKAVLINNTLKHLQSHSDLWHLHTASGGGRVLSNCKETDNNIKDSEQKNEEAQTISEKKSTFSSKCGTTELLHEKNTLSEDMLTLYDDIVNDIFGNGENTDIANQKEEQEEKENVIENYKENYLLSPYSYNSFLSELYTVSSSNDQLHV